MKKLLLFVFLFVSKFAVCDTIEDKYFRIIYQITENDSEIVVSLTKRNISQNKIIESHWKYWEKYDLDYFDKYFTSDSIDWSLCQIEIDNLEKWALQGIYVNSEVRTDQLYAPKNWRALIYFTKVEHKRERTIVFSIPKEVFKKHKTITLIESYKIMKDWQYRGIYKPKQGTIFRIKIAPKM